MFEKIKEDVKRLNETGTIGVRVVIRGLLSQGFQAIIVYRLFNYLKRKRIPAQPFRFVLERIIEIITGISIPAECHIDKGLRIHHFGGIILHPTVILGANCTMYHCVTIGDAGGYGGAAKIGDNVMIGAGAKIIGEITIGGNCRIGANSVVNCDVPDYSVVYGNPCIIEKRSRISEHGDGGYEKN